MNWPALEYPQWQDTCETLHMIAQIVGKTRLAFAPHQNQFWESAMYVTARGLTTSSVPYADGIFDIEIDLVGHELVIRTSKGEERKIALRPHPVAEFYNEYKQALHELRIDPKLWSMPVEVVDPIPFSQDTTHRQYDGEAVTRFFQVLVNLDTLFKQYRAEFQGKSSPVHFFFGSFDLAVTRFSGQRAPERPGADLVTKEAYSHEEISCGFWPGSPSFPRAAFYAYAAPEPPGLKDRQVQPAAARYDTTLNEFILFYDDVRTSTTPEQDVLNFCRSVYASAAELGGWDRAALDYTPAKRAVA
ncbi:MAG TPA: DUF5996 family protein [Terriglobales bacterium]|jgi:hypothetical protein